MRQLQYAKPHGCGTPLGLSLSSRVDIQVTARLLGVATCRETLGLLSGRSSGLHLGIARLHGSHRTVEDR